MRLTKDEYYLSVANAVSMRGTCLRRNYGAIIVKNDRVVSTGYTGAPRGVKNCCDIGKCLRNVLGCKAGERYDVCCSIHAEMNAIIHGTYSDMVGADMFVSGTERETGKIVNSLPCYMCFRFIVNSQIGRVIYHTGTGFGVITQNDLLFYVENYNQKLIEQGV